MSAESLPRAPNYIEKRAEQTTEEREYAVWQSLPRPSSNSSSFRL